MFIVRRTVPTVAAFEAVTCNYSECGQFRLQAVFWSTQFFDPAEYECVRVETILLHPRLALIIYRLPTVDLRDSPHFFMPMRGVRGSVN